MFFVSEAKRYNENPKKCISGQTIHGLLKPRKNLSGTFPLT